MIRAGTPLPAPTSTTSISRSRPSATTTWLATGWMPTAIPTPNRLIARNEAFLDDRGRTYLTKTYAVDPATGAVGNATGPATPGTTPPATPSSSRPPAARAFTQDRLRQPRPGGQAVTTGYDLSEPLPVGSWQFQQLQQFRGRQLHPEPPTSPATTILQQSETDYDAAGNVILATVRRRFHNATGYRRVDQPQRLPAQGPVSYVALYADPIGTEYRQCELRHQRRVFVVPWQHGARPERHSAGLFDRIRLHGPGLQDHRPGGQGGPAILRRCRPGDQDHPELQGRQRSTPATRTRTLRSRWPTTPTANC